MERCASGAGGRALWLIGLWLLLAPLMVASGARAQAPSPAPTPALSRAQAQSALSVLTDDKQRAALITTLEAIARAAPPAASEAPAQAAAGNAPPAATAPAPPAANAPPAAPVKFEPDSVGAALVERLTVMLSVYAQEFAESVRSVNNLPLLWEWMSSQAANPVAREAVIEALAKLLVVLALALLAEYLVRRLFSRIRATVIDWAPHGEEAADSAQAGPTPELRRHRFERLINALRQVPYLLGRLLLDLLPVAAFVLAADLLLGTQLGTPPEARPVILQAVQAYAYARVILAVAAFLFSPATPRLRLLGMTDWAAAFLSRWARRLTVAAVSGLAVANIGLQFGMGLTARLALLKLFALVVHAMLVVAVLQARAPVTRRLQPRATSVGVWAMLRRRAAERWHLIAIVVIIGLWLVWAVQVRNGYERLLGFVASTTLVMLGARLLNVFLLGGIERVRVAIDPAGAGRVKGYYPVLRAGLSALIWVLTAVALLEVWGVPVLLWVGAGGLGGRVMDAMITIVITVLIAVVVWEGINSGLARHVAALSSSAQLARAGRIRTLMPLLRTSLLVTLVLTVGMIVLSEIGVNIAPLLAGAGVLGIAIGFGSQKLVQDLITGLFLLLENAMQVGDVVTLGGLTGTVEALSIRTIKLRALDGAVHLIPFSAVTTVTNQTRDYSYAVLDVSIGLNEEPGPVEKVLRAVAAEMQRDPAWQSIILAELDVLGVEKLTDLAWIMRVRMKTQPGSRWAVSRELNRRIKERFDQLAIESPFTSHRVLMRDPPVPQVAPATTEEAA